MIVARMRFILIAGRAVPMAVEVSRKSRRMSEAKNSRFSVAQMASGQKGTIVDISGGMHMISRLEAMGIRKGKEIKKVSTQLLRGPVLLQHDNTQTAIGCGMASRILVDIEAED